MYNECRKIIFYFDWIYSWKLIYFNWRLIREKRICSLKCIFMSLCEVTWENACDINFPSATSLRHFLWRFCFYPPMAPLFYSLETIDTPSPVYLISKIFLILHIFEICSNGLCNALCNIEKFPWGQLVRILLLYPSTLWPFLWHLSP